MKSMDSSWEICQAINYRLLHTELGLKSCPLPGTCDICPEIADIDEQTSKIPCLLSDLGKQRQELAQRMNFRHDDLTRTLPVEIVSRIFVLFRYSAPYDFGDRELFLSGPILLGSICQRWRDITLRTPELWTDVIINTKRDTNRLNITEEWLRRSGSLPLNLELTADGQLYHPEEDRYASYYLKLKQLLAVVKSHSRRWRNLYLTGQCDFPGLFDHLEDIADLNVLKIEPSFGFTNRTLPVSNLNMGIRPKKYILKAKFWMELPLEWETLTFLDINIIPVGRFLDIIRVAKQLSTCLVHSRSHPLLAITQAAHYSMRRLSADRNILSFLILPYLQHLQYTASDPAALEVLEAFVKRSSPPLQSMFLISINSPTFHLFKELSTITQLRLTFGNDEPNGPNLMDDFLQRLANDTDPSMTLPNLQTLEITAVARTANSWSLLADLLSPPNHPLDRRQTRPISFAAVTIMYDRADLAPPVRTEDMENLEMDKGTVVRLLQVRQSPGVELDLRILGDPDVLLHMSRIYGLPSTLSTYLSQTFPLRENLQETWWRFSRLMEV